MSANNAPGEVNKDKFFDSPNISSAEDEIEEVVDKEAEERKKRETVEIDGIPIEDKEIKYKAADIKKKGKMNYFVNVEGAEERAKAEAKRKEEAKKAAERKVEEIKKAAERQEKEAKTTEERRLVEEKKHIDDVNAYLKKQKKKAASDEKRIERGESKFANFFAGKRKIIIPIALAAIALIGVCVYFIVVLPIQRWQEEQESAAIDEKEAQEYAERTEKNLYYQAYLALGESADLKNALDNYDYDTVDLIYKEFLDKMENSADKAKLYADEAKRIWRSNPDEKERIYNLAALAFESDSENMDILQDLQGIYTYYNDQEKTRQIFEQIQIVRSQQAAETMEENPEPVEG